MGEGFRRLVENAALLVVLVYAYEVATRRLGRGRSALVALLAGVALGAIAVGAMVLSWALRPGIVFDTRSVVLSVGTLFFGTLPGAVAGAIAAAWRLGMGGPGAAMGVSVIAMSVAVGALWRRWRTVSRRDPGAGELLLFGLLVHALMLALTVLLPEPLPVLRAIAAPVLTVYPAATVALGLLLVDQRQRLRAEEGRRESEERLAAIVRGLPGGLVHVFDREFRYLYNDGEGMRTLGLRNEDLVGRRVDEVLGPELGELVMGHYRRVLAGETVRFEGPYGGRHFMVTAAPLRAADGTVQRILALSVDVTDRKRAEDEVRRLNEELEARVRARTRELEVAAAEMESLAYSIAHDLRGPLRAIDGFTALIGEECGERLGEPCREYFARVRAAVRRMAALIDGLLALSRLSRADLQVDDVDLSALARDILSELQAREPGRAVEAVVAPGLRVRGDGGLLRAALANLLENAWKFTRGRGRARIEVGVAERDGRQAFFVRDNGVGFDPQYAQRLFRPFERLHGDDFEGTGIGLAGVARVVARHHGGVWAEGSPGEGATFWFSLWEEPGAGAP